MLRWQTLKALRLAAVGIVLAVLLAACGGPSRSFSFQTRTFVVAATVAAREGRFPQTPRAVTPPLPPASLSERLPGAPGATP